MAATTNKKIANFICISLLALMFFEIFNGIFYHFVNNGILNLPITNHVYNLYIIIFPSLLTLKTLFSFEIFLILSYSPTSKSNPKLFGFPYI